MEVRLNVRNIDLRNAQEQVDNNVKQIRNAGRKALLAYAGLWGLAYDEAVALLERGRQTLDKAEHRGEALEAEANRRVQKVRDQAQSRLRDVEVRVENFQDKMIHRMERTEERAEVDLEAQVERVLARLGIPSRERIVKLSAEIEALNRKLDAQLAARQTVVTGSEQEPAVLPVAKYDEMTAREIIGLLDGLTIEELMVIRQYETEHENRVPIVREVDRRIEAMPIAGYDQMTVDEIEPRLNALNREQLDYLARYEAAHEDRTTLLRAIEREQEARR